ncbi:MAG: GTPase domain-containing protein [Clostridia bacterium]
MQDAVVVGRPRVGKTRFVETLADFLGHETPATPRVPTFGASLRAWRGGGETLPALTVKDRRGRPWLRLLDTEALREDISERSEQRRAMALSLLRLQEAHIVFHLLDAAQAGRLSGYHPAPLDREVHDYGVTRPVYVIIATKIDTLAAAEGVRRLRLQFPADPLIPVSLLTRRGLRDVRRFLAARATL